MKATLGLTLFAAQLSWKLWRPLWALFQIKAQISIWALYLSLKLRWLGPESLTGPWASSIRLLESNLDKRKFIRKPIKTNQILLDVDPQSSWNLLNTEGLPRGVLPREPEHLRINSNLFALVPRDKRSDDIMSFVQGQGDEEVIRARSKSAKKPRKCRDTH